MGEHSEEMVAALAEVERQEAAFVSAREALKAAEAEVRRATEDLRRINWRSWGSATGSLPAARKVVADIEAREAFKLLPAVRVRWSERSDWGEARIVQNGPKRAAVVRNPGGPRSMIPGSLEVHPDDVHLVRCMAGAE